MSFSLRELGKDRNMFHCRMKAFVNEKTRCLWASRNCKMKILRGLGLT
jgi:hypothetical protein